MIWDEHLQKKRPEPEERRHQVTIDAGDKLGNFPHGGDVGRNVEGIRDQQ